MMPRNLDLGLSLDLGLASQGSLTSSTTTSSSPAFPWSAALNSIVCAVGAAEDQGRTSTSPDSSAALSSASGKRELDRTGSVAAAGCDEDDGADGAGGRKKLRLSKDQAAVLEECFKTHSTLNPKQKVALANRLGLRPRQVEVWFQNRRARTKLKQTEVDCDYLKRWCDRLADENKRLEKELADLRALKAAPSLASALQRSSSAAAPVATLTMCPSCRRVATAGAPPRARRRITSNAIPNLTSPHPPPQPSPATCCPATASSSHPPPTGPARARGTLPRRLSLESSSKISSLTRGR